MASFWVAMSSILDFRGGLQASPWKWWHLRQVQWCEVENRSSVQQLCRRACYNHFETFWATWHCIESWLIDRNPYNGLVKSLHNWVRLSPYYRGKSSPGSFGHCSLKAKRGHESRVAFSELPTLTGEDVFNFGCWVCFLQSLAFTSWEWSPPSQYKQKHRWFQGLHGKT